MNQKNYFNNTFTDALTVKIKIIYRLIGFVICSLFHLFIINTKNYQKIYSDEIVMSSSFGFLNIIMWICYIFSFVGFIWIGLELVYPNITNKIATKLTIKVKQTIFTILDFGIIFPICALVAIFTYSFIFIITPISGTSMYPTINDKERVFVSYLDKIEQFDVIVLKVTPEDNYRVSENEYYIKRIIGMPGQSLTWIDKKLTITENGISKIVSEDFLPEDFYDEIIGYTNFDGLFQYKKDGKEYTSLVIPEGYYFVMGDNREKRNGVELSKDSRIIGLIPEDNIIGVAKYHMNGILIGRKIA